MKRKRPGRSGEDESSVPCEEGNRRMSDKQQCNVEEEWVIYVRVWRNGEGYEYEGRPFDLDWDLRAMQSWSEMALRLSFCVWPQTAGKATLLLRGLSQRILVFVDQLRNLSRKMMLYTHDSTLCIDRIYFFIHNSSTHIFTTIWLDFLKMYTDGVKSTMEAELVKKACELL